MNFWFETIGVILVAISGVIIGGKISGLKKTRWALAFCFPCVLIAMMAAARFNQALQFISPISLLAAGRTRYFVLSLAISMGLTAPISRLPYKFEKVIVCLVMAALVIWSSILPVAYPAFIKDSLAKIETKFDSNGICRQSTKYTCGPAAAVTALDRLGLSANEGEIAILSYASPVTGTLPATLCTALQNRYGSDGLNCRYQQFSSVKQLRNAGITLAVVKEATMIDHCIVVLEVKDEGITIADPAAGIELIPTERFEKIWRYFGIVLERDSVKRI